MTDNNDILTIYLTIILQARVGYEMADSQRRVLRRVGYNDLISNKQQQTSGIIVLLKTPKELQYLSSPAIFIDAYWLPNLWSMVYELIYHCLFTNQTQELQYTIASF